MNIKQGIAYVEAHSRDGEVINVTMYRRRHIFETDQGRYWLIRKVASVDGFNTLEDVLDAINERPDDYPYQEKRK